MPAARRARLRAPIRSTGRLPARYEIRWSRAAELAAVSASLIALVAQLF
jgi:hypothetical protein